MNRQELIARIAGQLQQLGTPFQMGNGADFTIAHEFLDAGWSTGKKRIQYDACITLDESGQDVNMWEKTTESGGGLSGGFGGSSFSQSGTTLFRKVKSIQYGPDGKAYEISLDLGAIPKGVKAAAKEGGWKFHTVLRREKAQYPAGRPVQAPAPAPVPAAAAVADASATFFCIHCGTRLPARSRFCGKCGKPQP